MIRKQSVFFLLVGLVLFFVACGQRGNDRKEEVVQENLEAKKNLQGIWLDDDGDDVAFRIKGDSVFFPDSTSMPAYFRVEKDSFVVVGGNTVKYHIVKQTPHLFVFVNQNGERVKLVKTDDESYLDLLLLRLSWLSIRTGLSNETPFSIMARRNIIVMFR